jgi:signal transduction histidine kinase
VSDLIFMLTATAATCVGVGLAGWMVLNALRRRSVTLSVVVCALVPVVAVIAAVQVNVQAMFLSQHDADVIAVVLTTAAVLAVALAVILGRRLAAGSRSIGARLNRLTEDYAESSAPPGRPASAELATLTTQLEEVHRKLAAARARGEALETNRRDLVAALSHDLRTPLAGIRALAEGLEDGVVSDMPAALAQIRANTERMARMADDLFELSRLRAMPQNARETLVSVRELAEDVVAEIRSGAEAGGVAVAVDVPDRLPVRGDGDELARALANLVANAVRHSPPGGIVRVCGWAGADEVGLSVSDSCGGIAETDLHRVFEPGWRGQSDRSADGDPGSGLGLAIVHEVVAAHRGRVTVSNVDDGCRFEIRLPTSGR